MLKCLIKKPGGPSIRKSTKLTGSCMISDVTETKTSIPDYFVSFQMQAALDDKESQRQTESLRQIGHLIHQVSYNTWIYL